MIRALIAGVLAFVSSYALIVLGGALWAARPQQNAPATCRAALSDTERATLDVAARSRLSQPAVPGGLNLPRGLTLPPGVSLYALVLQDPEAIQQLARRFLEGEAAGSGGLDTGP